MQEFDKKYYRIGDVAQILGIPVTTLRFWESQLTILKPKRNDKGTRFYTPADIETIKKIHYLVKDKGIKLEVAQAQIRANRDGVDKRFEVVDRLKSIRAQLKELQQAFDSMPQ
jgi:DNA-binding transcriptional MerR regulator